MRVRDFRVCACMRVRRVRETYRLRSRFGAWAAGARGGALRGPVGGVDDAGGNDERAHAHVLRGV